MVKMKKKKSKKSRKNKAEERASLLTRCNTLFDNNGNSHDPAKTLMDSLQADRMMVCDCGKSKVVNYCWDPDC